MARTKRPAPFYPDKPQALEMARPVPIRSAPVTGTNGPVRHIYDLPRISRQTQMSARRQRQEDRRALQERINQLNPIHVEHNRVPQPAIHGPAMGHDEVPQGTMMIPQFPQYTMMPPMVPYTPAPGPVMGDYGILQGQMMGAFQQPVPAMVAPMMPQPFNTQPTIGGFGVHQGAMMEGQIPENTMTAPMVSQPLAPGTTISHHDIPPAHMEGNPLPDHTMEQIMVDSFFTSTASKLPVKLQAKMEAALLLPDHVWEASMFEPPDMSGPAVDDRVSLQSQNFPPIAPGQEPVIGGVQEPIDEVALEEFFNTDDITCL